MTTMTARAPLWKDMLVSYCAFVCSCATLDPVSAIGRVSQDPQAKRLRLDCLWSLTGLLTLHSRPIQISDSVFESCVHSPGCVVSLLLRLSSPRVLQVWL